MGKILLIEDEGDMHKQVRQSLQKEGHVVCWVDDCPAAVGQWIEQNGNFECIILDLNLKMDGFEDEEVDEYYPVHGILVLDKIRDEVALKSKKEMIKGEITEQMDQELKNLIKKEVEDGKWDKFEEEIWKKTIVFSAFINDFKEKEKEINNSNSAHLFFIEKSTDEVTDRDTNTGIYNLVNAINNRFHKYRG